MNQSDQPSFTRRPTVPAAEAIMDDLASKKEAVAMAFANAKRRSQNGKRTRVRFIAQEKYGTILIDNLLESFVAAKSKGGGT